MRNVNQDTLNRAYKPFDLVSNKSNNVGMIRETSVNTCQDGFDNQVSYSIDWLIVVNEGDSRSAWWNHEELKKHCNIMVKIAENMCHPMGNNADKVKHVIGFK